MAQEEGGYMKRLAATVLIAVGGSCLPKAKRPHVSIEPFFTMDQT